MFLVVILSLILIFFAIPVAFLFTAVNLKSGGKSLVNVIENLVIAFVGYLLATGIMLFFAIGIVANLAETAKFVVQDEASPIMEIYGVLIIWGYAFAGYLLCVLIKGQFFNPFTIFKRQKPISILNPPRN